MALTKIGSIGINTGIAFAGVTTITTLNGSDAILSVGGTVNFVSDVSIGGSVSIGGTLTYEDVTNIDAVGLITARDGIEVTDKGVQVGTGATVDSASANTLTFLTNGSERARITGIGSFGIGVIAPEKTLHVHGNALIENTIGNNLTVRSTVSNGNDPNFRFEKGRGGGTPAIVQNGDDCGDLTWRGYDGDSYETGASILAEVEGTPADGDMPMRMTLKTRSAGAGSEQGRLRLSADGTVTILNDGDFVIPDKIIHDGDTNTAIRFPAADTVSFETAGSERARINSDGRVLVNITASRNVGSANARMLQVESSGGGSGVSIVRNSDNTSGATLDLGKSRGYPNTIVQDGDKLGVVNFCGADGTNLETVGAQITGEVDGTPGENDMPGRIVFKTNDNSASSLERVRIDSTGLVGIGASSTGARLHISDTENNGGIKLVDSSTSSGSPNFEIISKRSDSNGNTSFSSNIYLGKNRTDQKVTSGIILGTVNFGGNHTDGTEANISYSAAIRVVASGDFNSKSDMPTDMSFCTGTSGKDRSGELAGQSNVGTERVRITSGGQLLVPAGTQAAPSLSFLTNSDAGFYTPADNNIGVVIDGDEKYEFGLSNFIPSDDNTRDLGQASFRWDDVRATNGSIVTSDKKEKNTITTSDLGLDFVNKLTPVSYKFNDKTRTHYGLIAQDIETVLGTISKSATDFAGFCKDTITEDADGTVLDTPFDRYGLRYTEFISPMIKAIQELSAENTALKARVAALEG